MNDPLRIWLNRTYAENAFFIGLLRENADGVPIEVHATHIDPDSPVLRAADHASAEPEGLSEAAYVEYALAYCQRNGIRLFLPRLHQGAVARHAEEFAAVGTTVLSPPPAAIELFADKAGAYESLAAIGLPVPPWWRVRNAPQLLEAVAGIEELGGVPCLKPVTGAGGEGFRVLSRKPFTLARLAGAPSWHVSLDHVLQALELATRPDRPDPVDWLVMPHLAGPEVSVDCLGDRNGRVRAAVGRFKDGRRRGFTLDASYVEPTRQLAEAFGLAYLTNIQFRHWQGKPMLLDINTRPSGGLHQLSRCGVNLPWGAVQIALGQDPANVTVDRLGEDYTLISTPYPALPRQLPVPAPRPEPEPEALAVLGTATAAAEAGSTGPSA